MRFGPFEFGFKKKKGYSDLVAMMEREKGGGSSIISKKRPRMQIQEYKSWVYSCVSLISDRVSSLPYGFFNSETGEEITTKNKGYRIFSKPFFEPNPLMSFRFIKSFCQMQLDLCGMTCLYKAYNQLGQVWEIWPLNMSDFVRVDVGGALTSPKVSYVFRVGAKEFNFDIDELIVINYPHPENPYAPMSPVQAQAYAVDLQTYVEIYERDFFANSARIDMVLSTEAQLDDQKAESIKQRWMSKFNRKYHDVAVLDSGLKVTPMNFSNKDFEFLNLAQWTKELTVSAYRVPMNKLGSTDSNRAGSVYTDISFNRESIAPRINLWDEELTQGILWSFDKRIMITHQNPIPRDRQLEVQEAKAYCSIPTMTPNEFRKKIHKMKPIKGGDELIIPEGYIRLSDLDKIIDAKVTSLNKPNQVDRDRDDETPHTNPDGTDDRDDNPTDGRAIEHQEIKRIEQKKDVQYFESVFREPWNESIAAALVDKENVERNVKAVYDMLVLTTISTVASVIGKKKIKAIDDEWVILIVDKASAEFVKTIWKNPKHEEQEWCDYVKEQLGINVRLAKINNSLLRSSINYAIWFMLNQNEKEYVWQVNSNECGHKGRMKIFEKGVFEVGGMKMRFPCEILNFNCDCTLEIK